MLAVNKMDLVDYDRDAFDAIVADYRAVAAATGIEQWDAIPLSGLTGDNVAEPQRGDRLVRRAEPDRMARGGADRQRRGEATRCACRCNGSIARATTFAALPGRSRRGACGRATRCASCRRGGSASVARIVTADGDLDEAVAGQSVTLTLAEEVDCSRGDVIADAAATRRRPPTSSK